MSVQRTDLEIVQLCGEAAGYTVTDRRGVDGYLWVQRNGIWRWYWPLEALDQVMELILLFQVDINRDYVALWYPEHAKSNIPDLVSITTRPFVKRWDISRAVCECVADMQVSARMHARKNNAKG